MAKEMAGTKVTRIKKETPPFQFKGSYYDGGGIYHDDGTTVMTFQISETTCCGVHELHEMGFTNSFHDGKKWVQKGIKEQEVFNRAMDLFFNKELHSDDGSDWGCGVIQLTLTRPKNTKNQVCWQPMLENYLQRAINCFCAPWVDNPNSENQIQVWLIYV